MRRPWVEPVLRERLSVAQAIVLFDPTFHVKKIDWLA